MFVTFTSGGIVERSSNHDFAPDAMAVPAALAEVPVRQLGRVGTTMTDLSTLSAFYIDTLGNKNPSDGSPGWPKLACQWADKITRNASGKWVVADSVDGRKAGLIAYAKAKRAATERSGITVNVVSAGAPAQNVAASTDLASLVLLYGAAFQSMTNPGTSTNWVQDNGVTVTLTSAQILAVMNAVTDHIGATFTTLAGLLTGIAGTTITTEAQIDAAFAAAS